MSIWEARIDRPTAKIVRGPRRITDWPGSAIYELSISNEWRRLTFLKGSYQADVYVGDLRDRGTHLKQTRRLTFDDADDLPTAWTHDGSAVLFHSNRNGKWRIWKQDVDKRIAGVVASDQADDKGARLSADGNSISISVGLRVGYGPQHFQRNWYGLLCRAALSERS